MEIRIVTVGRPKPSELYALVEEYHRRMRRWCRLDWQVIPEFPYRPGQEAVALTREGDRLLAAIRPEERVILLAIQGETVDSPALAERMARWQEREKRVAFVIGGSLGVDSRVADRANWRWSLSPLTFPHGIAQLLLAEQVYRAFTILAGHPYHKD